MVLDINDRQKDLIPNFSTEIAMIVGVGGIGNWLALDLALIGVKTLILIDPDTIEETNLNRTFFKLSDIGRPKVDALKDLILERRSSCIIITHQEYFSMKHLNLYKNVYMFDCTDTLNTRNFIQHERDKIKDYIKLGYDGFEGTVCHDDFLSGSWGEDSNNSYRIVPSFFGTPQVLATLGITEVLLKSNIKNKSKNINVTEIL